MSMIIKNKGVRKKMPIKLNKMSRNLIIKDCARILNDISRDFKFQDFYHKKTREALDYFLSMLYTN